jgi:hypothetical protein
VALSLNDGGSSRLARQVYPRGGELRGAIRGVKPHIDSPRMRLELMGRHYIVVRMAYLVSPDKGWDNKKSGSGAFIRCCSQPRHSLRLIEALRGFGAMTTTHLCAPHSVQLAMIERWSESLTPSPSSICADLHVYDRARLRWGGGSYGRAQSRHPSRRLVRNCF